MKIGFIGLGNMGSGMCANIAKGGHEVHAFDLNNDAVQKAVANGAIAAESIREAVSGAHVVVSMLPAGKHVHQVYFGDDGVASHADKGTLFIDCSTIAVEDARNAIEHAQKLGYQMVDAPVSGGVAAAAGGTLTFMVGGSDPAFQSAKQILDIMGQKIVHAGQAGNGQAAKIANNMLLAISMIGTCEAFALAEKLGLDAQTFFDISSKASGQSWSMTSYCPAPGPVPTAPSNNDYKPGFAVNMMLKDLDLATDAAELCDVDTPLGQLSHSIYRQLSLGGYGDQDFSIVMKQFAGTL